MFYLIGLGLGDAKDVTVKGLEIIRKCDKVFLEAYTSILTVGKEVLVSPCLFSYIWKVFYVKVSMYKQIFQEEFYQRPLIIADRDLCESNIDEILKEAKVQDIALLVVGDPLGATTHTDMLLRAKDFGVETMVKWYNSCLII